MPNTLPDSQMLTVANHAATHGIADLPLGEALTAALLLNRCDWLSECGYTIADALARIGEGWASRIPAVAELFRTELALARLRFAYEITSCDDDEGGYKLRLLDEGKLVGTARFPARGKSVRFADDQAAYDEAQAAGRAWISEMQSTILPPALVC